CRSASSVGWRWPGCWCPKWTSWCWTSPPTTCHWRWWKNWKRRCAAIPARWSSPRTTGCGVAAGQGKRWSCAPGKWWPRRCVGPATRRGAYACYLQNNVREARDLVDVVECRLEDQLVRADLLEALDGRPQRLRVPVHALGRVVRVVAVHLVVVVDVRPALVHVAEGEVVDHHEPRVTVTSGFLPGATGG